MTRLLRFFRRRPSVSPSQVKDAMGLKMSRETARKLLCVAIATATTR